MKLKLEKVFERDIDLLVLNKFLTDNNFKNIFLDKINVDNEYNVVLAEHSLVDENGESDITVILENKNEKISLLIEDKIDAVAMPNQRGIYNLRGNKGIEKNIYSKYYVFIIAPQSYLDNNFEAKKYENKVSYEELLDYFKNDVYANSIISQAIEEKRKEYTAIENKNITEFWKHYYKYIKENYPILSIKEHNGPRGNNASWPIFTTPVKQVTITHKSDRGYIDMSFRSMSDYYNIFCEYISDLIDKDMSIQKTKKSMSIRIKVPIIDFNMNFNDYLTEIKIVIDNIVRLYELLKKNRC